MRMHLDQGLYVVKIYSIAMIQTVRVRFKYSYGLEHIYTMGLIYNLVFDLGFYCRVSFVVHNLSYLLEVVSNEVKILYLSRGGLKARNGGGGIIIDGHMPG